MVQLNLSWRVGQMIVASDNMGDLHLDIVHDHAKIVRRSSVRSRNDQVVELAILKNDIAFNKIIDNGGSKLKRAESDCIRLALRQTRNDAFGRATSPIIRRFALFLLRELTFGIEILRCADARIGFADSQ